MARVYQFKVEFPHKWPLWRVVEVRGDQNLDHLHRAIQGSFGWGDDHPYLFSLERRRTQRFDNPEVEFLDPRVESVCGQRCASHVEIGELGLRPRRRFRYLFDFGDYLLHSVTVVKIGPAEQGVVYPRVIESQGQNASQYALWS